MNQSNRDVIKREMDGKRMIYCPVEKAWMTREGHRNLIEKHRDQGVKVTTTKESESDE